LSVSEIRPDGWLKTQIEENLDGFTGHLDSLAPDLMIRDDIYGKDRLSKQTKRKDLGVIADSGDWQVQYFWWNSESQSNWWDGFIRSAILTRNQVELEKAQRYVRRLLSTQDKDGYLGIYDAGLRYRFDGENGELWAKTTLLRGLLAWYGYSKDKTVLAAIQRAVNNVMVHYPPGTAHPFYSKTPYVGGLSHGLVFTDVLEELFRLTGKQAYLDYCLFLYRDFSGEVLSEDAQYAKLMDTAYRLKGHGVHTYEHLRAVAAAYYASGNPALNAALANYLKKIDSEINPSGGPAGDEWIGGRSGDATTTGYEYCSLQELMNSYTDLLAKTGEAGFGDRAEHLFFNAAQGSRDPEASCIAYLKTDNSYYMTGTLNGDTSRHKQTRYKYSPVHQDAAVCCVPNAGRIAPYYVQSMWMKDDQGLVAALLGPSEVNTHWKGVPVGIREITGYPYDFLIDYEVTVAHPLRFTLKIRKPSWSSACTINGRRMQDKDGYFSIARTWKNGDHVRLRLAPDLTVQRDRAGAAYFMYGPLVLAHPIAGTPTITRRYPLPGFYDYAYRPDSLVVYGYRNGHLKRTDSDSSGSGMLRFAATLYNPVSGKEIDVLLEPMGETILRQVTFAGNSQ
jgi:DUF1680 family protein